MNYFLYRFKYRFGKNLPLKKPVDLSLELVSHCNMSCNYCYHANENPGFVKGFMPWKMAHEAIKEAADLGVHSIKFNYRGESTMHPDFESITKLAKDLACGSTLIDRLTNSNFKFGHNKETIFRGLCNQTKVKISYDSFRKEVFETQRAGGKHELTSRNIDKFYNYPGRNNRIVIQAVRTKLNKDEDLESQIKKRWPSAEMSIRDMVEGRVDNDLSDLTHKKRDISERQACVQAFVRLMLRWDGTVGACCPDIDQKINLGSFPYRSLETLFNSKEAKLLRETLKNKSAFKGNPCKGCSSFETYANYKPSWDS